MPSEDASNDRLRSILVMLATAGTIAFNGLSAAGYLNNITPAEISARYPTILTPAGYAFSIWSLIYFGLAAFAVVQMMPQHLARFRGVRTLFIASCVVNCGWIYFWHHDHPAICLVLIVLLAAILLLLTAGVADADSGEMRTAKVTFGLYAGWVSLAAIVNLFVVFTAYGIKCSQTTSGVLGICAILLASVAAVLVVWKLKNYIFPLAVAWGLTAIAVKQSGNTAVVVSSAIGVIICLLASLSFVVYLPTMSVPQKENE